ncbi:MAG: RNA methyltransferase [Tidjanibacter sp.]|nr:RNA methyltransferase [Tidjanibacter sp.]
MITKAEIQLVKQLADKQARVAEGLFVAEGDKLVGEIVAGSGWTIRKLYLTEGSSIRSAQAVEVTAKEMERMSGLKSAPRSLALVEIPRRDVPQASEGELMLCLDEIQDPGNLGTIIRTADWYGIRHIVCSPTTADCFAPKVVQATMGALLRVEVSYCDIVEWLGEAARRGVATYATTLDGANIHSTPLTKGGVIVMGNEGKGVSPRVQSLVSRKLFIPPYPADRHGSESLNVAIATAITLENFRSR